MNEFIKLLQDFNDNQQLNLDEYGTISNYVNDNIKIRDCTSPGLDTIIEHSVGSKTKQVSFGGKDFKVSLEELSALLGPYRIAYNFRDDFTAFFFESIPNKKTIQTVMCKKNGEIKFVPDRNAFLGYSEDGTVTEFPSKDKVRFDNFTFVF